MSTWLAVHGLGNIAKRQRKRYKGLEVGESHDRNTAHRNKKEAEMKNTVDSLCKDRNKMNTKPLTFKRIHCKLKR